MHAISFAIIFTKCFAVVFGEHRNPSSAFGKLLHSRSLNRARIFSISGGETPNEIHDALLTIGTESEGSADALEEAKAVLEKTPSTSSISKNNKQEVIERTMKRTGPAILMLCSVYFLIKTFGENGLIGLIMLMQIGMYFEVTGIMSSFHQSSWKEHSIVEYGEKWWWFGTIFSYTTIRPLIFNRERNISKSTFDLCCFGMVSVGLLASVLGMELSRVGDEKHNDGLRQYLGKMAGYQYASIFLLGQSSFWIHTIQAYGIESIIYPALLVVINDTMAYFFGVTMGKRKIIPRLSPKKTVEGFVGAALSTFLASVPLLKLILSYSSDDSKILPVFQDDKMYATVAFITAAYTSFVSPFGGFLASAVKRAFLCKDFGTLIPGHGGVVDRFDCQIVTAPFIYLLLNSLTSK